MFKSARQFVRSSQTFSMGTKRSFSLLNADTGKLGTKFFHLSGYTLVALLPVALVYCPSPPLTIPLDLALGVIMPIHGHVGLNYIISDYVPQSARAAARAGVLAVTAATVLGLLRLNLQGPGLCASLKQLWKLPAEKAQLEPAK